MKTLLTDVDGHKTYVELIDCLSPKGHKTLRFTTVFERSRHPEGERQAYSVTMSTESLETLNRILNA